MINSVSAVSFKAGTQSAQERLNDPGKFTIKPQTFENEASPEKKGGFLKGLAGFVAGVIVAGGALLLAYKKGALKMLEQTDMQDAKWYEKGAHYLGTAGKWLDANIWQKIPGVVKAEA